VLLSSTQRLNMSGCSFLVNIPFELSDFSLHLDVLDKQLDSTLWL